MYYKNDLANKKNAITLRHSELDPESQIATDSFAPVPKCHSELDSESQITIEMPKLVRYDSALC